MDDKQEEQLYNPSHPIEKPVVCYEELNNKEEGEGSQMHVPFCCSNS